MHHMLLQMTHSSSISTSEELTEAGVRVVVAAVHNFTLSA